MSDYNYMKIKGKFFYHDDIFEYSFNVLDCNIEEFLASSMEEEWIKFLNENKDYFGIVEQDNDDEELELDFSNFEYEELYEFEEAFQKVYDFWFDNEHLLSEITESEN